jgi:hypothetical protein
MKHEDQDQDQSKRNKERELVLRTKIAKAINDTYTDDPFIMTEPLGALVDNMADIIAPSTTPDDELQDLMVAIGVSLISKIRKIRNEMKLSGPQGSMPQPSTLQ